MSYIANWTPETVTRAEIDSLSGPVLVEFGTDWCPHCVSIQPPLKVALEGLPEVTHFKIEDGKGRALGRSFGVKLWPNFVLMHDGKIVEQLARPDPETLVGSLTAFGSRPS